MNNLKNEYFIIFGGGGIRGLSYAGAYKALLDNNITPTGWAGSSIGAVFASLIAIGYTYQESYELLAETGFEMFRDLNFDIKKEIAFSKGNVFLDWIKEKIELKFYKENYKKGKNEPVKFCDIKEKLIIYSVDLTNMKFKEFSCSETPDFEIASAVRASVSMPGLFTPMEIDEKLIVDGDLLKSAPLWRLSNSIKNLNERIIEFRLEDNETIKKVSNSIEYINRVYNAICGFATDYIIDLYKEKDKFDYIKINTPDISVVDFLIPKEKKQELYEIGYNTTNNYFKNYYPLKRNNLKNKYEKMLNYLKCFEKEFNKNSINSYLKLCETFVYLCEEKKYLDARLCELLTNFKDNFKNSYSSINFLWFKNTNIKNKKDLEEQLFKIIKFICLKLEELS